MHSTRLPNRLSKFIIMTHLPLRRASADYSYLQHIVVETERHLCNSTVIKEEEISYILFSNHVLHVEFVYLHRYDSVRLLQYLNYIVVINLSSTFDSTTILICN
jgi:hypothetical protein